jgi:hypothetical protein
VALGRGLKVGLSWRGGTFEHAQPGAFDPPQEPAPLLCGGAAHFVSLQYGDCAAELAAPAPGGNAVLHYCAEAIHHHEETVALVGALDLVVISVQPTILHLSGAINLIGNSSTGGAVFT